MLVWDAGLDIYDPLPGHSLPQTTPMNKRMVIRGGNMNLIELLWYALTVLWASTTTPTSTRDNGPPKSEYDIRMLCNNRYKQMRVAGKLYIQLYIKGELITKASHLFPLWVVAFGEEQLELYEFSVFECSLLCDIVEWDFFVEQYKTKHPHTRSCFEMFRVYVLCNNM